MCYCCMYKRFFCNCDHNEIFYFFKLLNRQFLNIVALIVYIYENYRSKMHDQIVLILIIFDQFIISLSYNL